VKVHPVSSLVELSWLGSSQPPRGPGWTNLLRNYTLATTAIYADYAASPHEAAFVADVFASDALARGSVGGSV
jgi:hypothetical protein